MLMNKLSQPVVASLALAVLIGGITRSGPPQVQAGEAITTEQIKFFESKVRPLLSGRCFKCHGKDKQKGSLRLDSRAELLAGGESGPAVVPGDVDSSLLMEAVRWESFEMPPDGELPDTAVTVFAKWVDMGAPWPSGVGPSGVARSDTGAAVRPKGPKITESDRAFWSFQPIRAYDVPALDDDTWSVNSIDRFVLRRLREEGLSPAARGSRQMLIRRATFDLLGIPPTPAEVRRFVADESPDAYPRLIDRLLDRPEYGERWARHWLDLVRYAESDGFRQDAYRKNAWRYRDYVIRSFNEDKPYDRFVQEQLAGDELWPGNPEAMVATSLLRLGIYEFNQRDVRTQWSDILNEITDVTADVFLGLGLSCARCHDHKFDPILQEDYFRLRAFFVPLLPRDDLPLSEPAEVARYQAELAKWRRKTAEIRVRLAELEAPARAKAADAAINKFPLDIRPMMRKVAADREPFEHQLAEMANRQVLLEYEKLDFGAKLKDPAKEEWESLQKQLAQFDQLKPKPLPTAFTVTDVGVTAPPTRIPGRRDAADIPPGFLTILDPNPARLPTDLPNSQTTGRRTALALWLTDPANPLTTRVFVNRIWQQLFGQGLVATTSDFGSLGEPPTHPELLDWLATEFVARGWSMKRLHRLILNSAAYQQTSLRSIPPKARLNDPDNLWLWRMPVRRLDAEQIRDAMLFASGELESHRGGAGVEPDKPRRSIYTKVMRNAVDPLLAAFDVTDGLSSVPKRNRTTTPTQSLLMINGDWTLARSAAMARRLRRDNNDPRRQVEAAFWQAYSRSPTTEETDGALAFLKAQRQLAVPCDQAVGSLPGRDDTALDLTPGPAEHLPQLSGAALADKDGFTIEATVMLRSMYSDSAVRTIAAQWDDSKKNAGWSLGVTSKTSGYKPLNLILQLVGPDNDGKVVYEVAPSNLRLKLNTPYYVAASVSSADTKATGITFYLRELREGAELQTAQVPHRVVKPARSETPFTVGGRAGVVHHQWDGLLDDLRLSDQALKSEQLLVSGGVSGPPTVGHWMFDTTRGAEDDFRQLFADHGPGGRRLARPVASARDQALADLCHALLNSSEFLYVD